jgi:hypothetical protein
MSIHDAIILALTEALSVATQDLIPMDDTTRAGAVGPGPMQGNPDPDVARIAINIFENDPDAFYNSGASGMKDSWPDVVEEIECGGSITWKRRFTVTARCLLVNTQEDLLATRAIASKVRSRIEQTLLAFQGTGITDADTGEYVSLGVFGDTLKGEMIQAGGPDAYDYHIKVRFELQTTIGVTL